MGLSLHTKTSLWVCPYPVTQSQLPRPATALTLLDPHVNALQYRALQEAFEDMHILNGSRWNEDIEVLWRPGTGDEHTFTEFCAVFAKLYED